MIISIIFLIFSYARQERLSGEALIRFQLSDYVPQDNFYRQLKGILNFNFLYPSTAKYYGSEGQKSIDPVVFMKLMLVGYLENLNSGRCIIATSRMRMDILYFIGYDLDEELPWHSTLSRTRQLYGEQEFMSLFKLVLNINCCCATATSPGAFFMCAGHGDQINEHEIIICPFIS